MIRNFMALLAVIGFAVILVPLVLSFAAPEGLGAVASAYVEAVPDHLGSANIVTGIVVTYRGFDTLGEVSVLFLAAAGVGFVLRGAGTSSGDESSSSTDVGPATRRPPSEILATGATVLTPLLLLLGVYIFVHGHLTPGGGFQGGVVIASALVLTILGSASGRLSHRVLVAVESLSGAGYVLMGVAGIVWASGFLDTTWLGTGTLGTLVSAGAIPVIYTLVGLKVGTELTGIVEQLRERHE